MKKKCLLSNVYSNSNFIISVIFIRPMIEQKHFFLIWKIVFNSFNDYEKLYHTIDIKKYTVASMLNI